MNQIKPDPLAVTTRRLQQVLDTDCQGGDAQWAKDVHHALGQLATAIQADVQAAAHIVAAIGEINPDFQNAPVAERHIQSTREQLLKLGEEVHQLRADIRHASDRNVVDSDHFRRQGTEICGAVAKVRHLDNDFLQNTLNSNPGAGE